MFILLHPSINSPEQTSVSIPAVIPMLNLPTGLNSFGIVHCIHTSGCDCNGPVLIKSKICLCSTLSGFKAFIGVCPQFIGTIDILNLSILISDKTKSLA